MGLAEMRNMEHKCCSVCDKKLSDERDIEHGYCLLCELQVAMDLNDWMGGYGGY